MDVASRLASVYEGNRPHKDRYAAYKEDATRFAEEYADIFLTVPGRKVGRMVLRKTQFPSENIRDRQQLKVVLQAYNTKVSTYKEMSNML